MELVWQKKIDQDKIELDQQESSLLYSSTNQLKRINKNQFLYKHLLI